MQGNTPEFLIAAVRGRCTSDSIAPPRSPAGTRNLKPASARKNGIMRKLVLPGIVLVLLGTLAGLASGGSASGKLIVTVSDEVGPLPGAVVTISHTRGFVKSTSVQADCC